MGTLSLPFSGATMISRHRSAQAAQAASATRVTKSLRYLELLDKVGPVGISDHQTARAMGWPLSTVNSVRNGLGTLVEPAAEHDISPFGRKTTRWKKR